MFIHKANQKQNRIRTKEMRDESNLTATTTTRTNSIRKTNRLHKKLLYQKTKSIELKKHQKGESCVVQQSTTTIRKKHKKVI